MRSSVGTLRPGLRRPRLALAGMPHVLLPLAKLAAFCALIAACLWFGLPQSLGGRADWVMVSGTSILHMPVLLGLFAAFGVFFWIVLSDDEQKPEETD